MGREFQNDSKLATPEGAVLGGVGPYHTISESLSLSQLRPQHALLGWFRAAFPQLHRPIPRGAGEFHSIR